MLSLYIDILCALYNSSLKFNWFCPTHNYYNFLNDLFQNFLVVPMDYIKTKTQSVERFILIFLCSLIFLLWLNVFIIDTYLIFCYSLVKNLYSYPRIDLFCIFQLGICSK